MIIFQSVILQHILLITGAKNIPARIKFQLDSLNCGALGELVNDTYTAAMGYLGRDRKTESKEQRHCTSSNIVLRGKLHEAVIFVFK